MGIASGVAVVVGGDGGGYRHRSDGPRAGVIIEKAVDWVSETCLPW